MDWHKRYSGDYARDTGHLSLCEHGAYAVLLDAFYSTEKPIPAAGAHRVARAFEKHEREAVDSVLLQFWKRTPDGWVNPRAIVEIGKANAKSAAASRAARAMHESCERRANAERTQSERTDSAPADGVRPQSNARACQTSRLQTPDPDTRDQTPDQDAATDNAGAREDGWPASPPPTLSNTGGPNSGPTRKQRDAIASYAEELDHVPPAPRTKAEASRLIEEMKVGVEHQRAKRLETAREAGRLQGKVDGRHLQATDATQEMVERIQRRR